MTKKLKPKTTFTTSLTQQSKYSLFDENDRIQNSQAYTNMLHYFPISGNIFEKFPNVELILKEFFFFGYCEVEAFYLHS